MREANPCACVPFSLAAPFTVGRVSPFPSPRRCACLARPAAAPRKRGRVTRRAWSTPERFRKGKMRNSTTALDAATGPAGAAVQRPREQPRVCPRSRGKTPLPRETGLGRPAAGLASSWQAWKCRSPSHESASEASGPPGTDAAAPGSRGDSRELMTFEGQLALRRGTGFALIQAAPGVSPPRPPLGSPGRRGASSSLRTARLALPRSPMPPGPPGRPPVAAKSRVTSSGGPLQCRPQADARG